MSSTKTTSAAALECVFAVMPFGLCAIPAIGPATLKAILKRKGIQACVYNFNLEYLATIASDLQGAWRLHDEIAYLWDFLPGEWLFSPQGDPAADTAYLRQLAKQSAVPEKIITLLTSLRPQAESFAVYCASRLVASGASVIGFTTSFMQTQPSLSVARHIKRLSPQTRVVFGGANCFGEMGPALLAAYEQIDVVATGEADSTIASLVRALRAGDMAAVAQLPGYAVRLGDEIRIQPDRDPGVVMDDLPDPDFSDYFATLSDLRTHVGPLDGLPMFLPIETSRGCWWGAKSHCTFCGLNADRMAFRSKSAERAFEEFERQSDLYGLHHFFAVDNIMDHRYFSTLLTRMAASSKRYFVHYEIKANLRRDHVDAMRKAGIMKVQPGIESLSTSLLKLMRKGISALQNVQTLKWLTEGGFDVSWFVLTGFPGESIESYLEMTRTIQHIRHLIPPGNVAPVYIERFSPYQVRPLDFGIRITGPTHWYRHAFPELPEKMLDRVAYRFEYEDPSRDETINHFIERTLTPMVEAWKKQYSEVGPTLHLLNSPSGVSALVIGPLSRPERIVLLPTLYAELLSAADEITSRQHLGRVITVDWDSMGPRRIEPAVMSAYLERFANIVVDERDLADTVDAAVERLLENGLMLAEGERVLGLPILGENAVVAEIAGMQSATTTAGWSLASGAANVRA